MTADGVTVSIEVAGARVLVGAPEGLAANRLAADWSRCGAVVSSSDEPSADAAPEFSVTGEERSLHGLATNLTIRVIGRLAGTHLMLHAAGLSTQDGRVHVLVGASGAGKTTAATRLCSDLFGYVTDELVAIDPDGSVTAYPKPLSVVEPSLGHAKGQYGPDQLGLQPTSDVLSSGAFVILERHPEAKVPELQKLMLAEALLDLLPHTSSIVYLPLPLQVLCRLLEDGGVYRLTYAEIAEAGPLLASLGTPVDRQDWQPEPAPEATPLLWDGRYRRAPVVDAVRIGDEIVALGTGAPVRIMGIGVSVWDAAGSAARLEDLVEASVAAHGSHPDAQGLVEEATRMLVESGMLHHERPLSLDDVMAGQSMCDGTAADTLP